MSDAAVPDLILIVDDVEEDRVYLRSILEQGGYEVCAADCAEDGLQMARQRHPKLIVMDVKLPGISGFEATRRLKADPLTARTPVIVVTAYESEPRSVRDPRHDALLLKPVSDVELLSLVTRFLEPR